MAHHPLVIFPEPQRIECADARVVLGTLGSPPAVALAAGTADDPVVQAALERAQRAVARFSAPDAVPAERATISLAVEPGCTSFAAGNHGQAYALEARDGAVRVTASSPVGLLYGAATLAQLIRSEGDEIVVPECLIRDWPAMRFRGLFCESRWGPDRMTLEDWKDAIDTLADLKLNTLTIGIYNCWPIQYHGQPSEFLFVPLHGHPALSTSQHIEYYSAIEGKIKRLEYLADMFVNDTFGEVVAYGKMRGVTVRPHFNTPGHNTLIPRLIPEISALNADGDPTGYGFCLTNPKTYDVMFGILDEICDRYLLPNGVTSFHIAGDEVYSLIGMDPARPLARLSPWCECAACSGHTPGELYVEYILRIAGHLHDRGITEISLWHDQLVRSEQMGTGLRQRLRDAGLQGSIVLHWWSYGGFFDDTLPELGLRRRVTPMTGYYYQLPYRGHLDNIHLAERKGHEQGAEGTESYGVFDHAFHRHFCALSEWSWNAAAGTPSDFGAKYLQALFGEHAALGEQGFRHFGAIVDSAAASQVAWSLFPYSFDYGQTEDQANARDNYPQYTLRELLAAPPGLAVAPLAALVAEAREARAVFAREDIWRDPYLRTIYLLECDRLIAMGTAWLESLAILRAYDALRSSLEGAVESLASLANRTDDVLSAFDGLFARIETEREHYLVPHMLREPTLMRQFVARLGEELGLLRDDLLTGPNRQLPALSCMKVREVEWVERQDHRGSVNI